MPLTGTSLSEDIREFHQGSTYSRTKKKYGKRKADRQAIAAAYSAKRRHKGKRNKRKKSRRNG